MPRTLDPDLQALIDSGTCEDHTAIIITLADGVTPPLHFATGEALAEVDGDPQTFAAELRDSDALKLSLSAEFDNKALKVQNVDKVFGQQLTSVSSALTGATAVLGHIFVNPDNDDVFFDPKMPGDLMTGAVAEDSVGISFVGEIYAASVVTDPIAAVFPYQNPPAVGPQIVSDPNDLIDPNIDPDVDPLRLPWKGRLPGDTGFFLLP